MWDYSPRQAAAFTVLMRRRQRQERRLTLQLSAIAAQGDEKTIKRTLKDLDGDKG